MATRGRPPSALLAVDANILLAVLLGRRSRTTFETVAAARPVLTSARAADEVRKVISSRASRSSGDAEALLATSGWSARTCMLAASMPPSRPWPKRSLRVTRRPRMPTSSPARGSSMLISGATTAISREPVGRHGRTQTSSDRSTGAARSPFGAAGRRPHVGSRNRARTSERRISTIQTHFDEWFLRTRPPAAARRSSARRRRCGPSRPPAPRTPPARNGRAAPR